MKKLMLASLAAAGLLISGGAFAATDDAAFKGVDTDHNAQVSWPEFQLFYPDSNEQQFKNADANGDGWLDLDEFNVVALSTGSIRGTPPSGDGEGAGPSTDSLTSQD